MESRYEQIAAVLEAGESAVLAAMRMAHVWRVVQAVGI
jgi:hypothetical protein